MKRHLVWGNHIRNRLITRLAKASRAGDRTTLSNHFPAVAPVLERHAPKRTIVLVDGMDHLLALTERLPGWPLVTSQHLDVTGLTAKQSRLLAKRRRVWNVSPDMLLTAAGAEDMEPITSDG